MCFVFISEQTATCATYSINWLIFITQMKSVYSAVRTGSLNIIQVKFSLQSAWLHLCIFYCKTNWFSSFQSDLWHKHSCLLHPSFIVVRLNSINLTFRRPQNSGMLHFTSIRTQTDYMNEQCLCMNSWMPSAVLRRKHIPAVTEIAM